MNQTYVVLVARSTRGGRRRSGRRAALDGSLHFTGLRGRARTAWPDAKLYLAPGLSEKRKDLSGAPELGSDSDPGWSAEVDQCLIEGSPRLGEVVFRHRASRTLILTDWVFNVGRPDSLGARFFFTLTGVLGGVSVSRLIRFLTRDNAAARRSFECVLQWDFNRIVMAHGEVLEQDGPRCLRDALTRIGMASD